MENRYTFSKYAALQNRINHNQITQEEYIVNLNKLDRSITNNIIFAEKRCRKLRAGQVPYSPEINEAGNTINVWNNIILKKKGINQLSLPECEQVKKLATKNINI